MVGTAAVRFFLPSTKTVAVSSNYLQFFSKTTIKPQTPEEFNVPNIEFAELRIPAQDEKTVQQEFQAEWKIAQKENVTKTGLPFYEPIVLSRVFMTSELPKDLISLFKEFRFDERANHVMLAESLKPLTQDTVSTRLAKSQALAADEVEPEFFEYVEEKVEVKEVSAAITAEKVQQAALKTAEKKETIEEAMVTSVVTPEAVTEAVTEEVTAPETTPEEISINDLVAFDHGKASQDITNSSLPTVSSVAVAKPVHTAKAASARLSTPMTVAPTVQVEVPQQEASGLVGPQSVDSETQENQKKNLEAPKTYPSQMNIQITATDLRNVKPEVGFEIRYQDDLSEALQDYNSGEIRLKEVLARPLMTRSVTILKRGFAPTNTDLMVEAGEVAVSIPVMDEDKFNELLAPYESRGPLGSVLVELDDDTDGADLDIPYSKVIQLDGDLRQTTEGDFRYALFIGVKAGNALLSYKTFKGEVISKIIHIHERELTYDSNFFEAVDDESVQILEEDLLAKEKTPLIISSEQVKQFATNKTSSKLNDHTYKMDFSQIARGGRRYIELGHQDEPVYVGLRESTGVSVPSENFMRFILSKIEGAKLGNRCLVQVNLSKKALKVDVGAESVGNNLMTYTQILDSDGKFYDSVSEKSHKVIVVGENQGASEISQEAKINFKVTYEDGSVQYLGSYCSPNSYVVEQL